MRQRTLLAVAALLYIASNVFTVVYTRRAEAAANPPWIDCKKFAPKPLVKDFDGRLWLVDICAVAQDDAGASQYKTEVKQK